ncbi:hypothetical protein LTS18_001270, partial [Coniosporium uncinatum]
MLFPVFQLALCALFRPSVSQGSMDDYERVAGYEKLIGNARGYATPAITPRWLPDGDAFWYRRDLPDGTSKFVFVDATTGGKRPAFDQKKLVALLSSKLGVEVNPDELPFTWIDPARDGSWVRFRVEDKIWQYGKNGSLTPTYGMMSNAPTVKPMPVEFPSAGQGEQVRLTFINESKKPISLFWISTEGTPTAYGSVEAGKSKTQNTYAGHVWRVTDATNKKIASYLAPNDEAQVVVDDTTGLTKVQSPEDQSKQRNVTAAQDAPYDVFVRGYNVWLREGSGRETKISNNGNAGNPYSP